MVRSLRSRGTRLRGRSLTILVIVAVVGLGSLPRAGAGAGAPYRVGGIVDVELFPGAEIGARARFDALNRDGGIDGRTIEFLGVHDDGRDPAAALAETRRLVRRVGVDAIVPIETSRFTDDGTLADARVPAFGWGIAGGFCGNRWTFAITGCRAPLLPRRGPGHLGRSRRLGAADPRRVAVRPRRS